MKLEGQWFRHYKGTRYVVVGEAQHSETGERLIIYHSEMDTKNWARPYDMFMENLPDGRRRFEPIPSPLVISTIELRRTEAVVVVNVIEGRFDVSFPKTAYQRGTLDIAARNRRCSFELKITKGTRSSLPDGFFDGPFELRYSDEEGRQYKLVDCQVPEGSYPFFLKGDYNYDESGF